jgi:hypothetical protein
MAKVLVLLTNPYPKDDRPLSNQGEVTEWAGCWWRNKSDIGDGCKFEVLFCNISNGYKLNDLIYKSTSNTPIPNKEEVLYILLPSIVSLIKELNAQRFDISATERALVVANDDGNVDDLRRYLYREGHEVCIRAHYSQDDYKRYAADEDYWGQLMQLRYGGVENRNRNGNLSFSPSRSAAFDHVWSHDKLKCPDNVSQNAFTKKKEKDFSEQKKDTSSAGVQREKLDPGSRANRLSTLKHDLSHLFLPIDTDLQGWEESGFDREYGKEIAEVYRPEKITGVLAKARRIVYGESGSIKSIVEEVNLDDSEEWGNLKGWFPPDEQSYPDAWNALQALGKDDIEEAQEILVEREQTFRKWFQEVEDLLYQLQLKLASWHDQQESSET